MFVGLTNRNHVCQECRWQGDLHEVIHALLGQFDKCVSWPFSTIAIRHAQNGGTNRSMDNVVSQGS